MILHDFRCRLCGKVFERMVKWDEETCACECGSNALRVFISRGEYRAQSFAPVLVFRDASGHYRFPGRNNQRTPKGCEAVWLRTTSEVRKFERKINESERRRYFAHKERNEKRFEQWISNARSELRQKMQHMSPHGRDLAIAAMRENDRQSSVNYRFDPQFRLEAFSQDASNREAQYDRDLSRRK
jgi:putative FmdB family regulatory protein